MKKQFEILKTTRKNTIALLDSCNKEELVKIPTNYNNNILWNAAHNLVTLQLLCYKISENPLNIDNKFIDAFRKGRAYIVANLHDKRDEQATIIKKELSKVIGYKAVDYLNGYMTKIAAGNTADAFHALSEGYGFVMSLQFTNDGTDNPYFTNSEVNAFLELMDNFWTVQNSDLESIRDEVKTKFGI